MLSSVTKIRIFVLNKLYFDELENVREGDPFVMIDGKCLNSVYSSTVRIGKKHKLRREQGEYLCFIFVENIFCLLKKDLTRSHEQRYSCSY